MQMPRIFLVMLCFMVQLRSWTIHAQIRPVPPPIMKIASMDIPDHILIRRIMHKAYSQLGIQVEFVELPGKRALVESSSGRLDADLSRILDVKEEYPTLLPVPTSMFWFAPVAYSHLEKLNTDGPDAFKKYRIGVMLGMYYTEKAAAAFGQVTQVDDLEQLYQLLNSRRVDVVIDSDINGKFFIKKKGYRSIQAITSHLARVNAYHFVHRKHKDLIPKLDKILTEMKKRGELDQMRRDFLREMDQGKPP